jgi:hypothetical protein
MTHPEHTYPAVPPARDDVQPEENPVESDAVNPAAPDIAAVRVEVGDNNWDADEMLPAADAPESAQPAFVPDPEQIRLQELNLAIELHPDSAVNYLLRGEWFLAKNQHYLAQADFHKAAQLAEMQLETSAWGFTEQWTRDKALTYLRDLES